MVSTRKGNKIYLHLLNYPATNLTLPFPKGTKVKNAYFLQGNSSLDIVQDNNSIHINLPKSLQTEIATVIVLTLDKPAMDIDVIRRLRY